MTQVLLRRIALLVVIVLKVLCKGFHVREVLTLLQEQVNAPCALLESTALTQVLFQQIAQQEVIARKDRFRQHHVAEIRSQMPRRVLAKLAKLD